MEKDKQVEKFTNLKEMLQVTGKLYGDRPAYKVKHIDGENVTYTSYTHKEARDMIDGLGTALITLGLKDKRVAVIGENRYEWEIAYMAVTCGVGTVVPVDKSLPENELRRVIERSDVEAIIFSGKYEEELKNFVIAGVGKLKHLISMDSKTHDAGIYSMQELIEIGKLQIANGNREYLDAVVDPEAMRIMLFTSGTTSESKIVALCHRNLISNLLDMAEVLEVDCNDRILSFLPVHHVFECTVGFLFSLYRGCERSFCEGPRHILENLQEYKITFTSLVPALYDILLKNILKGLEKQGKLEAVKAAEEKYKDASMEVKAEVFKDIHALFGGCMRIFISGAAALDPNTERQFRAWGVDLRQGYGLTECSPVVSVERKNMINIGSIGPALPSVEAKILDPNEEGIGELAIKAPNVMMGYYGNEGATKDVMYGEYLLTGDLATIDKDGYIFIKGRKKSVIVLKNGKNIFPEEMEALVNRIEGVKESFIYGKSLKKDKSDEKIYVKVVIDRDIIKMAYKVETDEEIVKALKGRINEINATMPLYKAIKGVTISDNPLIKTTTGKIKRYEEIKTVE